MSSFSLKFSGIFSFEQSNPQNYGLTKLNLWHGKDQAKTNLRTWKEVWSFTQLLSTYICTEALLFSAITEKNFGNFQWAVNLLQVQKVMEVIPGLCSVFTVDWEREKPSIKWQEAAIHKWTDSLESLGQRRQWEPVYTEKGPKHYKPISIHMKQPQPNRGQTKAKK